MSEKTTAQLSDDFMEACDAERLHRDQLEEAKRRMIPLQMAHDAAVSRRERAWNALKASFTKGFSR